MSRKHNQPRWSGSPNTLNAQMTYLTKQCYAFKTFLNLMYHLLKSLPPKVLPNDKVKCCQLIFNPFNLLSAQLPQDDVSQSVFFSASLEVDHDEGSTKYLDDLLEEESSDQDRGPVTQCEMDYFTKKIRKGKDETKVDALRKTFC